MSRSIKRALAVTLLCGVAACASGPHKTEAQQQADKATVERVEAALEADKMLFATHINVHADHGVVWLTGYVWETTDLDEAKYIAENVPGVTRVVNDLELQRNGNSDNPVSR